MFGKKSLVFDYEDIRPYTDDEFKVVKQQLLENKTFLSSLAKALNPNTKKILQPAIYSLTVKKIKKLVEKAETIDDFQIDVLKPFIKSYVIDKKIDNLTYSGLDNLDPTNFYIFISNHRDIVLDATLLNYIFMEKGIPTTQNAIGGNLIEKKLVEDLLKINKSFVVKRGLPMRKQVEEFYKLSSYIKMTIDAGKSIWIAQREGRAKNGDDKTNPAILKMFYLSQRKSGVNFAKYIKSCNIVPVSFSYEFDPCDKLKAKELYYRNLMPDYIKSENEDLNSMLTGLNGFKGNVHISFGSPIRQNFKKENECAKFIDKQIYSKYKLFPSNYIAYDIFHNTDKFSDKYDSEYKEKFLSRYKDLTYTVRQKVFEQYANPVKNRYSL